MKVGIDAHMLGGTSEDESFYRGILDALKPDKGDVYYLFVDRDADVSRYKGKFKLVFFKSSNSFTRNIFELTKFCYKYDLDVIHTLHYVPFNSPCPVVCTINDISFEHEKNNGNKVEYFKNKLLIPFCAKHADRVITISNLSRRDIANTYDVSQKKIEVVSNAVASDFRRMDDDELDDLDVRGKYDLGYSPFILCVGDSQSDRNLSRLINAFIMYKERWDTNIKLVIVGKSSLYDDMYDEIEEYEDEILFTGCRDRLDLAAMVNESEGFICPSFVEGAGISPLEALNCGTPVAAADLPHTHEVLGNRAIYFDPYDEEDIYEGICRLVDDPVEAVASGNTWEDSSRRIKKVYRDAASEMC
ncbi:MAG: glycosyltransferase family 1 protein [Butyrivibrio sp.]|nr:glycosyltransferase family 1 protein [Butyrivibrio sp.]